MLFPEIPMLVLSATITRPVEAYLHTTLGLQSPTLLCRRPLFRKNIQTIFIPIKKVGFEELEFLMHVVPRPTTMIYVDDRNMAQNLARYLREKLRKQGESETMVVVYTGYQDVETRVQNMEEFRIGTNVKYMVCTEAAGMGLNIRHIKVVVQFKIAKFLTLPDLTQRLGRCARDPATKGAGFVFVNDKYIIPREALDEEFNSSADGRNYFLPITPETVASGEVRKMLDSIYSEENRESGSTLDPGLMWMINTVGCRSRVQLAVLGDEASAFWFPTESETILGRIEDTNCRVHVICNCDTCILGIATKYSRLIKPPCLREGLDRPGLTPAVRDAMRRALREKHSDVVCEREEAVMKINTTVAAHGDIYGLSLKRSIGYWDTAANEEEQIKEREAKLDTRQVTTARTKELKASIISAMCQKRSCIYVHENIEMRFSLTEIFFIPTEIISKIAASEDILTCSSACFTIQFLHTIVAKTEGVKNSIFDSYLNEFHRVIRRCIVEDEQRKQRAIEEQEARRQEAEEALRLSNQEPMMDFFNRRSQSRSRSTTPLPESQTTIGESQANFRQDGNIASRTSTPLSSRNGRSTSRATTPTLQSTQEVDYSLKLNEYGKGDEFFKGQEAHSKEVVPEPVRRRVLHKLPRVRYEDLDPNNPRQMEIWRLQEEDDEYVRQQQQRKVESRLMMLKNRAERDIAKKNAAEVARKKKQLEKEGQKVTKKKGKRGVRTDTEPDRPEEQNTEAEASTASTPSQGIDIPVPLLDPAIPAPTKAKRKYKKKDTNIETVPVHGDSTTSEPPDPPKPKTKGRPRKINTASEPPSTGQQPGALRRRISMRTRLATAAGIQLPTQPEPAPTRRKRKAEPAEGSLVDTDLDASEHISTYNRLCSMQMSFISLANILNYSVTFRRLIFIATFVPAIVIILIFFGILGILLPSTPCRRFVFANWLP